MNVPAPVRSRSTYGVGTITSGEAFYLLKPHGYVAPADRKCVIALHGHGGNALQFSVIGGWDGGKHVQNLAHNGYYVLSIDAGGGATWENAASMATVLAAYNYARTVLGIPGTKIAIFGWSMGGGNGLQFMKEQAAHVCGMYLWAPQSNLDYFHGIGTYTSEIDAAHGVVGGNYTTAAAGRRLAAEGFTPWQTGTPIHIAHGDADTTVPLSLSQAFVTGCGISQVTLSVIPGQTHGGVFTGVLPADTLAFFNGLSW